MITESEMYWITRLDDIRIFMAMCGGLVLGLSLVATVVLFVASAINKTPGRSCFGEAKAADEQSLALGKSLGRWALFTGSLAFLAVAMLTGRVFVPSTTQYAAIRVIPAIANNERVQSDAGELYGLAVQWAKQALKPANAAEKE